VDPAPRAYDDFAPMVTRPLHPGGLRSVPQRPSRRLRPPRRGADPARRSTPATAASVARCAASLGGTPSRALLTERFGLPARLVEDAVSVRRGGGPSCSTSRPGSRSAAGSSGGQRRRRAPDSREVPDVLVSLATVGRGPSVRRLLDTLAEEVRASGYPGRVGVLIVENHEAPPARSPTRRDHGPPRRHRRRCVRRSPAPPRRACSRPSATDCRCPSAPRERRSSPRSVRTSTRPSRGCPTRRPPDGGVDGGRRRRLPAARRGWAAPSAHPPAVPGRALLVARCRSTPSCWAPSPATRRSPAWTVSAASFTTSPRTSRGCATSAPTPTGSRRRRRRRPSTPTTTSPRPSRRAPTPCGPTRPTSPIDPCVTWRSPAA
jgi:hypothetical protein